MLEEKGNFPEFKIDKETKEDHSLAHKITFMAIMLGILTPPLVATPPISTAALNKEISTVAQREIAVHFADIKTFDPPPERVMGALTTGKFSWGSFMRALAAQADFGGNRIIAGKDTVRPIAEMGLIEARSKANGFSQLFSALALRHFGADLKENAVWQSMNEKERREWENLLDPTRIYDLKKRKVINLAENFVGVAARIVALSYQMGIANDRQVVDSVLDRAAEPFCKGFYADDHPPIERYDRYSNEYARFCWDAAETAGRTDILEKLKPSLKRQMALWWDLVSPEGYSYNWGRSQGLVSYLDVLEIAAFLGEHPEFRPAPLPDIASVYHLAWRWIDNDLDKNTHLFKIFEFGRGNCAYINRTREWQQTGTSLGKIILAHNTFMRVLKKEKITQIPSQPDLKPVSRFEFFSKTDDKQSGVWLVRQDNLHFALPITTGTKPGISDYLPAPFGLPGFAAPVEEVYPAMVPFLTLADGKTYVASEGAHHIEPTADGRSLKAFWHKWGQIGSQMGERFDPGLRSVVEFRWEGNKLIRSETVTAEKDILVKAWKVAFPMTGTNSHSTNNNGVITYIFTGREGTLSISVKSDWKTQTRIFATGDTRLGKGVLGHIPLHLVYEASDISLKKGESQSWEVVLELGNANLP